MEKAKLVFANEELKRVYYLPNMEGELKLYLDNNDDAVLIIDAYKLRQSDNFQSFDAFKEFKIHRLLISGTGVTKFDFKALLKNDMLLELVDRNLGEIPYDFLYFPSLEILRYSWSKKSKNIASCSKLKELSLWSYKPREQNLTYFSSMKSLEEVRIIQSNIKSIEGLESLLNIKVLVLIANRGLTFEGFNHVFHKVESLYLDGCNKIGDSFVKYFPNLKKLEYFSRVPLESLKNILDGLPKLEDLNIGDTMVLESDNTYWKNYKNIKIINFFDRRHQVLKLKDFASDWRKHE